MSSFVCDQIFNATLLILHKVSIQKQLLIIMMKEEMPTVNASLLISINYT